MRISPLGWIANSEEEVKVLLKTVIEITHNHPEDIKGAEAVAMLYNALHGVSKKEIKESMINEHYPEIADYMICKRKEGKDLICQCDYGVSRNAGCAAVILEMWNHKGLVILADYRYTPNQFVYNKVLKELKERNKQDGKLSN